MDVFYYWKNFEADMKAGRTGQFKSTPDKLKEFADGSPDFIWVFKSPSGKKGQLQLLGRLKWADKSTVGFKPEPGAVYMHCDPRDAQSISFAQGGSDPAIAATTQWVAHHFPKMLAANFQGVSGQESLRGLVLAELKRLSAGFGSQPFLAPADAQA